MGEEAEELKFELLERIEDAYRLPFSIQAFIFAIIEIVLFSFLYYFGIPLLQAFLTFLLVTAIIYPVVIKVRNPASELIGVILYGCLIAAVAAYLILNVEAMNTVEFWMIVIFLLVFGVELFHHMYEKARTLRTKPVIITDIILSAFFAFSVFMLLSLIIEALVWKILITTGATILYAYAIFPEKPY